MPPDVLLCQVPTSPDAFQQRKTYQHAANLSHVLPAAPQILTSTGGSHYDYREHLPAHQRKPGSGKDRNEPPPPVFQPSAEAYGDDEEEQLREAIELSLALEESRKLYADDYSYEEVLVMHMRPHLMLELCLACRCVCQQHGKSQAVT